MSTAATLALFARLLVSLGVVIGLMWFAARVVRRRGFGGLTDSNRGPGVQSTILARRTLGRNSSIAVVRAGQPSEWSSASPTSRSPSWPTPTSTEIDLANAEGQWTAPPQGPDGPTPSWKAMLDQLRDRTARR